MLVPADGDLTRAGEGATGVGTGADFVGVLLDEAATTGSTVAFDALARPMVSEMVPEEAEDLA